MKNNYLAESTEYSFDIFDKIIGKLWDQIAEAVTEVAYPSVLQTTRRSMSTVPTSVESIFLLTYQSIHDSINEHNEL